MRKTLAAILVAGALLPAVAQAADDAHDKKQAAATASPAAMADGEVRKVDKDAKKITLRHGPLQHLEMPAMTMVFQVKDPAFLDRVKVGDKVKFQAEKVGGAFTITQLEPAR